MLGLLFGHTVHAVATVLIVFMSGLALGSAILGGLTRRLSHPIMASGWLELGIGAWAALVPTLFGWSAAWYPDLFGTLGRSYAVLPWIQLAIGSALPLVPTALNEPGRAKEVLEQALALEPGDASLRSDLLLELGRLLGGADRSTSKNPRPAVR